MRCESCGATDGQHTPPPCVCECHAVPAQQADAAAPARECESGVDLDLWEKEAQAWPARLGVARDRLLTLVTRVRELQGCRFSERDWRALKSRADAAEADAAHYRAGVEAYRTEVSPYDRGDDVRAWERLDAERQAARDGSTGSSADQPKGVHDAEV